MISFIPRYITSGWILTHHPGALPYNQETIPVTEEFCLRKWKERAVELEQPPPTDLSNSSRTTSMFAKQVFGGVISGNRYHQFCFLKGQIVDLASNARDVREMMDPYHVDPEFLAGPVHVVSLEIRVTQVNRWIDEFNDEVFCKAPPPDPEDVVRRRLGFEPRARNDRAPRR